MVVMMICVWFLKKRAAFSHGEEKQGDSVCSFADVRETELKNRSYRLHILTPSLIS